MYSMTLPSDKKLQSILGSWEPQTVGTSAWLASLGISRQLTRHYVSHGWLAPIGTGAFKRPSESVGWQGAVRSLQRQLGLAVHVGALTALSAQGAAQYLRLGGETVHLFSGPAVTLPSWFRAYDWQTRIEAVRTSFLPAGLGLTTGTFGSLVLSMSAPERAILECLYLAPAKFDLVECYEILQGLVNLRPKVMQSLLESCGSIKVKRLFCYMAAKASLPVVRHLDRDKIELGHGDRSLAKGGLYDARYRLILPESLVRHD
jgi:hypothetical protein